QIGQLPGLRRGHGWPASFRLCDRLVRYPRRAAPSLPLRSGRNADELCALRSKDAGDRRSSVGDRDRTDRPSRRRSRTTPGGGHRRLRRGGPEAAERAVASLDYSLLSYRATATATAAEIEHAIRTCRVPERDRGA